MKHLKTKLSAAIVMLLISAMMLTGVSFAWYTLSTNPEVSNIKATAVANENLEIALDNVYANGAAVDTASTNATAGGSQGSTTLNYYTWGNLVDLTSILSTPFELRPAEYVTGTGLQTYKYGADGRISAVQALKEATYVKDAATAGVAGIYNDDSASDANYAFKVVYWLRTNEAGTISLCAATKRADGADATGLATGSGSTLTVTNSKKNGTADTATESTFASTDFGVVFATYTDGASAAKEWNRATVAADGTLTGTVITDAVANTAYKVVMYVFLDGDVVTNAHASGDAEVAVNVQFDNAAINTGAITAGGAMTY